MYMKRREQFFSAMRRQGSEYVPFEFVLCPSLEEKFKEQTGNSNYWEYFDFPQRGVWAPCTADAHRFDKYFPDKTRLTIDSSFGFGQRYGDMEHFFHMEPSLAKAKE